jgi:hypothetical protein
MCETHSKCGALNSCLAKYRSSTNGRFFKCSMMIVGPWSQPWPDVLISDWSTESLKRDRWSQPLVLSTCATAAPVQLWTV